MSEKAITYRDAKAEAQRFYSDEQYRESLPWSENVGALLCPECGEEVWDGPQGHKLAKCWNSDGHADGGTLAFDTMDNGEAV